MAKKMYVGVNNKARLVNKFYVGVNNKAREVKKAYVGVGNIARIFYESTGDVVAQSLSVARGALAAITIGNYALFGGGLTNSSCTNVIDAYNTSLTRSTPTTLSVARGGLAATIIGDYALFGGGGDLNNNRNVVDAYNTSLTRSIPTTLYENANFCAATTVGNYALFGGGIASDSGFGGSGSVTAYNSSLTRMSSNPTLSAMMFGTAATTIGNYALFSGGIQKYDVYVIDNSLSKSTISNGMNRPCIFTSATTVGNYALFGGGTMMNEPYNTTIAYNASLTKSTPTTLSVGRASLTAITFNNYALFGGGGDGLVIGNKMSRYLTDVIDAYNSSLTRSNHEPLSMARASLASAVINGYALFGGGTIADNCTDVKDVMDTYK